MTFATLAPAAVHVVAAVLVLGFVALIAVAAWALRWVREQERALLEQQDRSEERDA